MSRIIDKCILIPACIFFLFPSTERIRPVIAVLIASLASSLTFYFNGRKIKTFILFIFTTICFFLPELIFFLPVMIYDCILEKIYAGFVLLLPLIFHLSEESSVFLPNMLFLLLMLSIIAGLLALKTFRLTRLEHELIRLRDTSTELNIVLREKNKDLMEKQDYEVYLATLHERNRIAREIHDHVGHMLSRSILQLGALITIHKEEPLNEQLCQVNETLNRAMTNIRESVHDLHDESIDLRQAITEATGVLRDKYDVTIDFDMTPAVPRNVKYCIISVVKEAVSNIIKHSNADRILFILREHPGFYQLAIEDNGSNLPPSSEKLMEKNGIGLNNMRERTEALNGILRISIDKGFKIIMTIPREQK